jgi:hypothetical protein
MLVTARERRLSRIEPKPAFLFLFSVTTEAVPRKDGPYIAHKINPRRSLPFLIHRLSAQRPMRKQQTPQSPNHPANLQKPTPNSRSIIFNLLLLIPLSLPRAASLLLFLTSFLPSFLSFSPLNLSPSSFISSISVHQWFHFRHFSFH